MSDPASQARALADLAAQVATSAAALVRRQAGVGVADTKSSDVDVVTEADRAAERLIRDQLLQARPDDAILGEEGDDVSGSTGVRWIVDPIDGTVNFLYGRLEHAVSIAAEVDGRVVAGVVHRIPDDRVYRAHRDGSEGGVATCDGAPLAVRPPTTLSQRLIATGFSYSADVRGAQAQALTRLLPRVRDIRRGGSCALDLCGVAEGSIDGYLEEGVHLWDHAAGALVAELAGARTLVATGASGREFVLCAPAHGFAELLDAARDAGYLAATPDAT